MTFAGGAGERSLTGSLASWGTDGFTDGEELLGLGSERFPGDSFSPRFGETTLMRVAVKKNAEFSKKVLHFNKTFVLLQSQNKKGKPN